MRPLSEMDVSMARVRGVVDTAAAEEGTGVADEEVGRAVEPVEPAPAAGVVDPLPPEDEPAPAEDDESTLGAAGGGGETAAEPTLPSDAMVAAPVAGMSMSVAMARSGAI